MNLRIKQFGILKDVEIPLEGVVQIAGPHGSGRTSIEKAYNYLVTGVGGPGYVSLGDVVRRTEEGFYNPTKHKLVPPGWPRMREYECLDDWCRFQFWDAWIERVMVAAGGEDLVRDILNDHLDVGGEYVTLGGRLELEMSNLKGKIERLSARIKAMPLPPTDEQIEAQRSRVEGAENAVETGIAANALAALEAAKEGSALLETLRADRSRLRQRVVASEKLLKAIDTVPGPDHECKTLWKTICKDFTDLSGIEVRTLLAGGSEILVIGPRDAEPKTRPLSTLSSTEMWFWDTIVKAHCLAALQSPYLFVDMPTLDVGIESLVKSLSGAFKAIVCMYPMTLRPGAGDYYWLESGRLSTNQDATAHV